MPKIHLHVPAWHHVEQGDMPATEHMVYLDHLPRVDDQIEIPDNGVVEVNNVRFRPVWSKDGGQQGTPSPGGRWDHLERPPEVWTHWVHRPEGARVYRGSHKLGHRG
jgi:hypothetical protein